MVFKDQQNGTYSIYDIENTNKKIINARKRIGAIIETPSIYLSMTARENLMQQYKIVGLPSYEGLDELLEFVNLKKTGKKKVKQFSLRHETEIRHSCCISR